MQTELSHKYTDHMQSKLGRSHNLETPKDTALTIVRELQCSVLN